MKIVRTVLAAAAALLFCLIPALAAGGADPGRGSCTLTVHYQYAGEGGKTAALSGAGFSLYRVAGVSEEGTAGRAAEAFRGAGADLSDLTAGTAGTLAGYADLHGIPAGARGTTDLDGVLRWRGLSPGLYLLTGQRRSLDGYGYDPSPALVLLPQRTGDGWQNEASLSPNAGRVRLPAGGGTVSRRVTAVWEEGGEKRPRAVTVYLLRDGRAAGQSVTLHEGNHWTHLWRNLDAGSRWTVAGETVKGYTAQLDRRGNTFVLTQRPVPPAEPAAPDGPGPAQSGILAGPGEPQTGTLPQRWPVPLMAVGLLGLCLLGLLRRHSLLSGGGAF